MWYLRVLVVALMPLSIAACAARVGSDSRCDLSHGTNLFFGRDIENKREVSEEEWAAFLDETVRPRFPGHTVFDATGHWQQTSEKTKVLSIFHEGDAATSKQLTDIAEDYRRRFKQQSVLRADFDACVTFVSQ